MRGDRTSVGNQQLRGLGTPRACDVRDAPLRAGLLTHAEVLVSCYDYQRTRASYLSTARKHGQRAVVVLRDPPDLGLRSARTHSQR